MKPSRAAALSVTVYAALTAFLARDLLWNLGRAILGDDGDPLFVAALLHWNATTLPLTGAWWQLPIFHPTADAIAFSEHFLGVSPVSTPLQWMIGNPLVTYNLVTLLTFPLCGLAMFPLAYRLTRSAPAAFLAGLAFAFAPYRVSHLPHLQILAFFWAPLALLGLHGYLESRRRRWLVLYGAAWMLQGAANGYALVFLSILVGFWALWFVVARRDWSALGAIAAATVIAALPLVPILAKYVDVHAVHGFKRDVAEMRVYSGDVSAVLCAPERLTFWGWLRIGCRAEGELFPGVATAFASLMAFLLLPARSTADTRLRNPLTLISRILLAVGLIEAVVAASVAIAGPWGIEFGTMRVSASSIAKPVMLATALLVLSFLLSPTIRAAAKAASAQAFYIVAAVLTWLFALGPTVTFMGESRGFHAPFGLLLHLPGMAGFRVPARFWLLTTMCLAVLVAFAAAALFRNRRRWPLRSLVAAAAALLLMDGWIARLPAAPVTTAVPDARVLQNATVLNLPVDPLRDIHAEFHAVTGGWRLVNGYSGYFPAYYGPLVEGVREADEAVLLPYLARGDLHVIVSEADINLKRMIERQPGAVMTAVRSGGVQYRLPRRAALPHSDGGHESLRIAAVRASCAADDARRAVDNDGQTYWQCSPQTSTPELLVDLGAPLNVAAVVQDIAAIHTYPRHLMLQTSTDGAAWEMVWNGSVRGLLVAYAIDNPGSPPRISVPFAPRLARYIRLRQMARGQELPWSVAEIEVVAPR
jgi:hypothetical protein